MYIVIVGCGRLGSSLAMELSNDGYDVSIIDKIEENLELLGTGFNGHRIKGVEIDTDILLDAGIDRADVFLAMTRDDNINIMASQIAKNMFGVKTVIARIFDPSREIMYKKLGLAAINPTKLGATIIESRIIEDGTEVLTSLDDKLIIAEVVVKKSKTFKAEEIEQKYDCIISAVIRDGKVEKRHSEHDIKSGDILVCTIDKKNCKRLVHALSGEMQL